MNRPICIPFLFLAAALVIGCSSPPPLAERYVESDALFATVLENIEDSPDLSLVLELDHSRLGAAEGSGMPPSRVAIISNPDLETSIVAQNQLAALEMPLRVLAYEDVASGRGMVIANRFAYVAARHDLSMESDSAAAYESSLEEALQGISAASISDFETNEISPDGIITVESAYGFEETLRRLDVQIEAEDNALFFGRVDFQKQAASLGVTIPPTTLTLFGGPKPGANAMSRGPTLGLDAFCQKFLVWQIPRVVSS